MAEFVSYNANPDGNRVGDCTIRAISAFLGKSWEETYIGIALTGFIMRDMPSADSVWGSYLRQNGCCRYTIPNTAPADYTVREFCEDMPDGEYLLSIFSLDKSVGPITHSFLRVRRSNRRIMLLK